MNAYEHIDEIDRLISNQKTLLDNIPEPIMIVRGKLSIEYLNTSATLFFKKLTENLSKKWSLPPKLAEEFLLTVHDSIHLTSSDSSLHQVSFMEHQLECILVPFTGYKNDKLQWLLIRDITEKIKHEEELRLFHNNIENILSEKIKKLKESEKVRQELSKQVSNLKSQIANIPYEDTMVGSSKPMGELRDMVRQVAKSDATILITGESGTGKELVANMIREISNRKTKPFLKINCNAINDSLLESDLFGYERGAFTGAHARTKGKFEVVDGGTIFLDEIGDISPRMQAALLRVLQDGEIIRVGGNSPIKIRVRIIAATNRDLALAVQEKTFRLDLYYRLNIINISIPPLRQRKEDIEDLVSHFVRRYRLAFKKDVNFVPKSIIKKLAEHDWPGNIRELENVIQRAVLMTKKNIITEHEIFFDSPPGGEPYNLHMATAKQLTGSNIALKNILAEVEREILNDSLKKYHGNVAKAASELNLGKTAFYDKLKRYGLTSKEYR